MGHHVRLEFWMQRAVALDRIEHAQVQVAPLAHRFPLIVPLLPAVQSVFGGAFPLFSASARSRLARAQLALERAQHFRDLVVELSARNL